MPISSTTSRPGFGRKTLRLAKYSFGVGGRFARQARAQLRACMLAARDGIDVVPVWNKSCREHLIVGSKPGQVRKRLMMKWPRLQPPISGATAR